MTRAASHGYIPLSISGFATHTIQRIVGLTAAQHSTVRMPLERVRTNGRINVGILGQSSIATRQPLDELTPLDTDQMPDDDTDGYTKLNTDPYDGFVNTPDIPDPFNPRDPWVANRTPNVTIHEGVRPDLEAAAERLLATERGKFDVPGLPVPSFDKLGPRVIHTYKRRPITYVLGRKNCPRCHGTGNVFAKGRCQYCKGEGGWPITRSRLVPVRLSDGFIQHTPPVVTNFNTDGSIELRTPATPSLKRRYTPAWRTSGPYYGKVRRRRILPQPQPNLELMNAELEWAGYQTWKEQNAA